VDSGEAARSTEVTRRKLSKTVTSKPNLKSAKRSRSWNYHPPSWLRVHAWTATPTLPNTTPKHECPKRFMQTHAKVRAWEKQRNWKRVKGKARYRLNYKHIYIFNRHPDLINFIPLINAHVGSWLPIAEGAIRTTCIYRYKKISEHTVWSSYEV
jgi:hypothetical protein